MFIKIVFLFIIFLIKSVLNYIVIPFKTHHSINIKENDKDYNSTDFILNYYSNKIYFPIEVGFPQKEVAFILITTTSGLNIGYSICTLFNFSDIPKKYLEYFPDNSSTYNLTSKNIKSISNTFMGSQSTEQFKLYKNLDKKEYIIIEKLPFIYLSKNDVYEKYNDDIICGLIGLSLFERSSFKEDYHLINTLKKNKIIDNYIFTYEYSESNPEEGMLIIGEEPHNYNPQKYNKEQLIADYVVRDSIDLEWNIIFNSIYFFDENNNKISITNNKYCKFIPELNCIKGSSVYKKLIEEKFFNYYINKNICKYDFESLKLSNKNSYFYYAINCDINSEFKIEEFPSLYLWHKKYNYTFELNYNDLFIKKGNKFFFMIIYPYSNIEYFELGKIFLKKYFFSYDIDRKTISFYNKNIPINTKVENNENNNKSFSIYLIIGGILFIITACVIGFFFGKKCYEKVRNKRKNELEEDYDYSLNQ